MKKPTLATLKSFIRKNQDKLLIKCNSSFDGMTDCVEQNRNAAYRPIKPLDRTGCAFKQSEGSFDNTLGINGVWLVGGSRDHIKEINANGLFGYEVYNCCGCFEVVIEIVQAVAA